MSVKWVCVLVAAGGCYWLGGQALPHAAQLAELRQVPDQLPAAC